MNLSQLVDGQLHIVRGSVYYWDEYAFQNGNTRDKYWITLNCTVNDFPITAVLPTSQYGNAYYSLEYNMVDTVVLEPNESKFFSKKTIIDLKNIFDEDEHSIRSAHEANYLQFKGVIEDEIIRKIEEVIGNSKILDQVDKNDFLCIE